MFFFFPLGKSNIKKSICNSFLLFFYEVICGGGLYIRRTIKRELKIHESMHLSASF